jgi:fructokinase
MNKDNLPRIGIDLGGTKTEGILLAADGTELHRLRQATPQAEGYNAILANITSIVNELEAIAGQQCLVGIGTPGALSSVTGFLKNSNTVCMNGMPVKQDLEQRLGRAIRIQNDANCFALSEAVDGAARDHAVVFGVIMGTGVGGGIVIHRKIHEGLQHIAGEWGHIVLEADGPPCYCGRHGCVETFLSGPGLIRDYRLGGGEIGIDAKKIAALAQQGDAAAEAAMQRFLDRFGRALAMVINILDPDAVVLGGGLSNIDRLYTDGRARLSVHVFNDELRTPLLRNQHGDSSGVRGAAWL